MRYQVWYMKPSFFSDGIMGKLPNVANLTATHVHLKDIEANGLNHVYRDMQGENWSPNGEARELIQSKGLQHTSMSVGDVVVDDVGNAHVVANTGFNAIGGIKKSITWQQKAIVATAGSRFGAIIACVLDHKTKGPSFHGKASITSDGYVMCDFTDKNGDGHMGAFVGSASDVVANTCGLADHLKLSNEDRAALYAAIRGWVGQDYSNGAFKALEVKR